MHKYISVLQLGNWQSQNFRQYACIPKCKLCDLFQGYKFNIFYPDLIDKSATPVFKLLPVEQGEYCILRVTAGPPYEDIAFKIVNREWEYGYKRGFRCQFHNNIFQLWFHFKRYRYRR